MKTNRCNLRGRCEDTPLRCFICGTTCATKDNLKRHMSSKHQIHYPYSPEDEHSNDSDGDEDGDNDDNDNDDEEKEDEDRHASFMHAENEQCVNFLK